MSRIRQVYSAPNRPAGGRVAGGTIADFKAYPSLVRMLLPARAQNGSYILGVGLCGGTIITSTWILTAAHCCARDKAPTPWEIKYVQFQVGGFYDESCDKTGKGTIL